MRKVYAPELFSKYLFKEYEKMRAYDKIVAISEELDKEVCMSRRYFTPEKVQGLRDNGQDPYAYFASKWGCTRTEAKEYIIKNMYTPDLNSTKEGFDPKVYEVEFDELSLDDNEPSHDLKFKVGDKVRLVADRFNACICGIEIGKVYTIAEVDKGERGDSNMSWQEYGLDIGKEDWWVWVCESDLERAEPMKTTRHLMEDSMRMFGVDREVVDSFPAGHLLRVDPYNEMPPPDFDPARYITEKEVAEDMMVFGTGVGYIKMAKDRANVEAQRVTAEEWFGVDFGVEGQEIKEEKPSEEFTELFRSLKSKLGI